MYSIYVTNKTEDDVYIRLQHEKLSASNPRFYDELDKLKEVKTKDSLSSYLVRWGFCLIPAAHHDHTMPFTIDVANEGTRKYASLYAGSKLWTMDFEMNCIRYGCLFVKSTRDRKLNVTFHLNQANPEPDWIPAQKRLRGDIQFIFSQVVKAGPEAYFGRSRMDGTPCTVTITKLNRQRTEILSIRNTVHGYNEDTVELLCDTGHEFVRAQTGDPVPPHAVITGVSEPEGSLYLGRVGGNTPCPISTSGGKIKSFHYRPGDSALKKVQSGEILVLTGKSQ